MKKTYSTPVIDIKKFDVADIITTSAADPSTPASTAETINKVGSVNQVEIVAKW